MPDCLYCGFVFWMGLMEVYARGKTILFEGEARSLYSLSKEFGVQKNTLRRRLERGMPIDEAVKTPSTRWETPRNTALALGETFFEGEICKKHDTRTRYVSNWSCVYCQQTY